MTAPSGAYADPVIACVDLVGRAGAREFALAWTCPHVPDQPDDHNCTQVTWHAHATYQGARITTDQHRTPIAAVMALAERMLSGATCRCHQPVSLSDQRAGCRWRLVGQRWEPGCDAPPVHVRGERGDHAAMVRAMEQTEPANRRERRAAKRKHQSTKGDST